MNLNLGLRSAGYGPITRDVKRNLEMWERDADDSSRFFGQRLFDDAEAQVPNSVELFSPDPDVLFRGGFAAQ